MEKHTKLTPSFNKLSPSKSMFSLCGVPSSVNKADTAIGSVDPSMEDITSNPLKGILKSRVCSIRANKMVQRSTPGNASSSMDLRFLLNMNRLLL